MDQFLLVNELIRDLRKMKAVISVGRYSKGGLLWKQHK